jgi:hypothetical protein
MWLTQFLCAPQFFKTPSGLCGHTVQFFKNHMYIHSFLRLNGVMFQLVETFNNFFLNARITRKLKVVECEIQSFGLSEWNRSLTEICKSAVSYRPLLNALAVRESQLFPVPASLSPQWGYLLPPSSPRVGKQRSEVTILRRHCVMFTMAMKMRLQT